MTRCIMSLSLILICVAGYAQNMNSVIRVQALEMARSLQKKDFSTFSKYMHPKVIEMAGGTAKLVQQMDTMNVMAKKFGADIKRITIGMPGKILSYKNELQTIIPETTEMTSAFGDIALETSLVAISSDGGKTWKFIDTSITNVKDLKKAMPDLSPDLIIPTMKAPKFTPKAATN